MIFYLSCTGNTKWAAEYIKSVINEELVSIFDIMNGDCSFTLKEGERIGFFFPVHGWRPPQTVRKFISKLIVNNFHNNFCYVVCTAGDNIGETIKIFNNDLAKIGLHTDSALSLIMPESYVGLPFMDVDTLKNEMKKRAKAKEQLKAFSECIISRRRGVNNLVIGKWPKINSRIIGDIFVKHIITDKPFRIDESKCIGCGICTKVCPVRNIESNKDNTPKWTKSGLCISCFSCYHHCPKHAIEYGNRTKNKGQYYYDKIK
jgi:NAD-dependent dihydropyrimidine dehydrogenase PreA subunit/flavodoxin